MDNLDLKILAAIISVGTSIVTVTVALKVRSIFENRNYVFRLENEHRYEQRKRLKEILSQNKIQLLNSCEQLNHRLWNFTQHYMDGWHNANGDYTNSGYYFNSFVYRFVSVFAWIKKIEDEMVYLDTTIALKEDMDFIKYLRLLPQLLWDVELFKGFTYDVNYQYDHLFRYNLEKMAQCLVRDNRVCSYTEFQDNLSKYMEKLEDACRFIENMSPDEDRLRWDRLQIVHIAIIAFLNTFGYDFQFTSNEKLKNLLNRTRKNKLLSNFVEILDRNRLTKQKELKNIIEALQLS